MIRTLLGLLVLLRYLYRIARRPLDRWRDPE